MCGGITVFGPLYEYNVRPTDRVGVIGIGGLGHMALKFLTVWAAKSPLSHRVPPNLMRLNAWARIESSPRMTKKLSTRRRLALR